MKKVERKLKQDITSISKLEVEDVKKHIEFEQQGVNINWRRVFTAVPILAAIMIAAVIQFGNLGTSTVTPTRTLSSVVTLDINPGLLINLDENNEVISVEALNADAEALLLEIDMTVTDFDKMVENIIEVANNQGFLLEQDTILLSVQGENEEALAELETELQNAIAKEAELLGKELETVMNKYKEILDTETSVISEAKAKLIEAIILAGDYTIDDIDELALMKVDDLKDALETSYGISIQEVMSEEQDQSNNGQEVVRAKLVEEILERDLLTLEEVASMETDDLRDVLKEANKISLDSVKEMAKAEVEETEREKYVVALLDTGLYTQEELDQMDSDDLEDALEEYYESIENEEEAKEKAIEKAQEAKEKAEEKAAEKNRVEDEAEEELDEAYDDLEEMQLEFEEEMAELELELSELQSGLVELEAQLSGLQDQLASSGLTETEIAEIEASIAELEVEIAEVNEDIAEINLEMAELIEEYEAEVAEKEMEVQEKVQETLREAHEEQEKVQNEVHKILAKGLNDYFEELLDSIDSEEEANELIAEIEEKYNEMIAELESMLSNSDLTEDGREDLEDIIKDTKEDLAELLEEIEEYLEELYEEEQERLDEDQEDLADLKDDLHELVDDYVLEVAEETRGNSENGSQQGVSDLEEEYLEELEELIFEIEKYEAMSQDLKDLYRTVTLDSLIQYLTEQLDNSSLSSEEVEMLQERLSSLQDGNESEIEFEEDETEDEEESEEEESEEESEEETEEEETE